MFEEGGFYRQTVEKMEFFQFSEEQINTLKKWCKLSGEKRIDELGRRSLGYNTLSYLDIFPEWFIQQSYRLDVIDGNINFEWDTINVGDYCLDDKPSSIIIIKKEDVNISTISDFFPDDNEGKHIAWIDEY